MSSVVAWHHIEVSLDKRERFSVLDVRAKRKVIVEKVELTQKDGGELTITKMTGPWFKNDGSLTFYRASLTPPFHEVQDMPDWLDQMQGRSFQMEGIEYREDEWWAE